MNAMYMFQGLGRAAQIFVRQNDIELQLLRNRWQRGEQVIPWRRITGDMIREPTWAFVLALVWFRFGVGVSGIGPVNFWASISI
jgi:hypothetical protein